MYTKGETCSIFLPDVLQIAKLTACFELHYVIASCLQFAAINHLASPCVPLLGN